ncbi:asparagine synthase (glutamine-hydrolyzing) [Lacinutrix mariniflava]|uniref:asparagine synthase (glutamine-hydrolyzing) n=1 Tax=Lacinutrix mariniflava TaxID=342955 RepID=UPI0006E21D88|nr:asparagine synthase (glutamine-hydrolyzing) [Lacinutrix mariniflava]
MCGIYGYINHSKLEDIKLIDRHKKSIDIISHRGPDNSTLKFYNTKSNDNDLFNIALGHNRLSIIDLNESANQPFEKDDYAIIFNGEIFNYIELREELIKKGVRFNTDSDTEVLLNLYIDQGSKAFNKLNGMWAFSILDKKKNELVLSRDRFGIKPLYYTETKDSFIFGSEAKQLLHHLEELKPNLSNIKDYLSLAFLDHNNDTFFDSIYKIPAATTRTIKLSSGQYNDEIYWNINNITPYKESYNEAVIEYGALFEDAVKIRLRSDVPVGNTLSGGLDSSSIAVVADKHTPNLLNFSVVSAEKGISEEVYVDELVKENNINVKKISSDALNPWKMLEEVIYHNDEPILSFSAVNHFNMMKKVKNETSLTVVLSGQGGDEGLCGYGKYTIMNILEAKKKGFSNLISEMYYAFPRLAKEFNFNLSKRYFNKLFPQKENFTFKVNTPKDFSISNNIVDRQVVDYQKYSVPPLCHYEDRNAMAYALEIRLPFLDYRLVEFSLGLPTEFKIKKGVSKRILRDAIKALPKRISQRKVKMGFNIPEREYFQLPEAKQFITKVLEKDSFPSRHNLLSQDLVKTLSQDKFSKKADFRLFQRIIFLEVWARKFNL